MESVKTRFFGRKRLIEDIVQGVLTPSQPLDFSLVGPKMIGKTRLLNYLASPQGPLRGADGVAIRPERFREGHNIITALYNCDWPDAKANLPEFIYRRLGTQLEREKNLGLDWSQIKSLGSPGQRIVQIARQLDQQHIRLVLMLDHFDRVLLSDQLTPDMINELRPLTSELGLIVATEYPLHDLNQTVAASPLFNLMHQHFIGLLEPDVAEAWLEVYRQGLTAWQPVVSKALQEMCGGHPFLLARLNDTILEIKPLLTSHTTIQTEHLPLIKLRLAEYGRPLFAVIWHKLDKKEHQAVLPLVKQFIDQPIPIDQITTEQRVALNWLINYAIVAYNGHTYHLFSPLLQEFLAEQMGLEHQTPTIWPATATTMTPGSGTATIFESLPPKEAELLRYFQAHSHDVISIDQLLNDVWNQPDASPRRVQEAIRRLRNNLNKHQPRIGIIENERGVGYRFIPAVPLN